MTPAITALYAAPLALLMTALSIHVTMLRAKTKISLLDGGNHHLTERIRRHGNFVENVPMVLLLMLLNHSRRASRLAKNGAFVPLESHDRRLWDKARIGEGIALLETALSRGRTGVYQLQAAKLAPSMPRRRAMRAHAGGKSRSCMSGCTRCRRTRCSSSTGQWRCLFRETRRRGGTP